MKLIQKLLMAVLAGVVMMSGSVHAIDKTPTLSLSSKKLPLTVGVAKKNLSTATQRTRESEESDGCSDVNCEDFHKLYAFLNILAALPKLRSDAADANKLQPKDKDDLRRSWLRAFDDQCLGGIRDLGGFVGDLLVLLHATAAGRGFFETDKNKAITIGAVIVVATKVLHMLYRIFTMGRVRANKKERTSYTKYFYSQCTDADLENLDTITRSLKLKSKLSFVATVVQSFAVTAMSHGLESGDLKDDIGFEAGVVALLASFTRTIIDWKFRSQFGSTLKQGIATGNVFRENNIKTPTRSVRIA